MFRSFLLSKIDGFNIWRGTTTRMGRKRRGPGRSFFSLLNKLVWRFFGFFVFFREIYVKFFVIYFWRRIWDRDCENFSELGISGPSHSLGSNGFAKLRDRFPGGPLPAEIARGQLRGSCHVLKGACEWELPAKMNCVWTHSQQLQLWRKSKWYYSNLACLEGSFFVVAGWKQV